MTVGDETPTPTTDEAIAQGRELAALLYQAEVSLADRRLGLIARIPEARAAAGRAALNAALKTARPSGGKDNLAALTAEIDALDAAVTEARVRRVEQIRLLYGIQALALHDQAVEIRKTIEDRQAVTTAMLDRLAEHEGVPYEPATIVSELGTRFRHQPRTAGLSAQAAELERQSSGLHERTVPHAGAIADAGGRDDLLAQVRALDPCALGPRLDAVSEWADLALAGIQPRADQLVDQGESVTVLLSIAWRDSQIIPRESYASVRVAERPAPPAPRTEYRNIGGMQVGRLVPA